MMQQQEDSQSQQQQQHSMEHEHQQEHNSKANFYMSGDIENETAPDDFILVEVVSRSIHVSSCTSVPLSRPETILWQE